jgi:hypothetical protein
VERAYKDKAVATAAAGLFNLRSLIIVIGGGPNAHSYLVADQPVWALAFKLSIALFDIEILFLQGDRRKCHIYAESPIHSRCPAMYDFICGQTQFC